MKKQDCPLIFKPEDFKPYKFPSRLRMLWWRLTFRKTRFVYGYDPSNGEDHAGLATKITFPNGKSVIKFELGEIIE